MILHPRQAGRASNRERLTPCVSILERPTWNGQPFQEFRGKRGTPLQRNIRRECPLGLHIETNLTDRFGASRYSYSARVTRSLRKNRKTVFYGPFLRMWSARRIACVCATMIGRGGCRWHPGRGSIVLDAPLKSSTVRRSAVTKNSIFFLCVLSTFSYSFLLLFFLFIIALQSSPPIHGVSPHTARV